MQELAGMTSGRSLAFGARCTCGRGTSAAMRYINSSVAAGGRCAGVALSERDRWICAEVGETLVRKGLVFVGLDAIGDYLTEINVSSPTCIRELEALYGLDIARQLMDAIERRLRWWQAAIPASWRRQFHLEAEIIAIPVAPNPVPLPDAPAPRPE